MGRLRSLPLVLVCIASTAFTTSCASLKAQANDCDSGHDGSRAQLKTPIASTEGPRIDAPLFCGKKDIDSSAYIRVHGRGGGRRIVLGHSTPAGRVPEPECVPTADDGPEVCPEVGATLVGLMVAAELQNQGILVIGMGMGACGDPRDDYESFRRSVKVADWKDADAAIATVDRVLQKLGIGHQFGVSLLGINGCYVAEQEGDEVSKRLL